MDIQNWCTTIKDPTNLMYMININEHSRNINAPLLLENTFDHNALQTASISMSHGFQNFIIKHYHIKYHWRTSLAFYRVFSLFRAMLSHRRSLPIYCLEKPLCELPKLSCSSLGLLLETNVISPQRLNFRLQICIFLSFLKEKKKIRIQGSSNVVVKYLIEYTCTWHFLSLSIYCTLSRSISSCSTLASSSWILCCGLDTVDLHTDLSMQGSRLLKQCNFKLLKSSHFSNSDEKLSIFLYFQQLKAYPWGWLVGGFV